MLSPKKGIPNLYKVAPVLIVGAIPSLIPAGIVSPKKRYRAVTLSPLYALLYNAGTLNCHTNDCQLPAGDGFSEANPIVIHGGPSPSDICIWSGWSFIIWQMNAGIKGCVPPQKREHL